MILPCAIENPKGAQWAFICIALTIIVPGVNIGLQTEKNFRATGQVTP